MTARRHFIGFYIVMLISLLGFFTLWELPQKEVAEVLFHKYRYDTILVEYGILFMTYMFFMLAYKSLKEIVKGYKVFDDMPIVDKLSEKLFLHLEGAKSSRFLERFRLIRENQKIYIADLKKRKIDNKTDFSSVERKIKHMNSVSKKKLSSLDTLVEALEFNERRQNRPQPHNFSND